MAGTLDQPGEGSALTPAFFWLETGIGMHRDKEVVLYRTHVPSGTVDVRFDFGGGPSRVHIFATLNGGKTYSLKLSYHEPKSLGVSGLWLLEDFLQEYVFPSYPLLRRILHPLPGYFDVYADELMRVILDRYHLRRIGSLWYYWDQQQGIYRSLEDLRDLIVRVIQNIAPPYLWGILRAAVPRVDDYIRGAVFKENEFSMDDYSRFIPFANGDYDTRTGRLFRPSPDRPFTFRLATPYNPRVGTRLAEDYINGLVEGEENQENLKRMLGYILWPGQPHNVYFVLYGSGANGKSTFLRVLSDALGPQAVTSVGLQEILHDRWATGRLLGKVVSIATETPEIEMRAGADDRLKAITGGDIVTVEFKYQQPFSAKINAKLIFAANRLPTGDYIDDAAHRRRMVLITFDKTFKPDPTVERRINTPAMRASILILALKYRPIVYRYGFLRASTQQFIERVKVLADPIGVFIDKFVEPAPGGRVRAKDLLAYFVRWADAKGIPHSYDSTDKYNVRRFMTEFIRVSATKGLQFRKTIGNDGNDRVTMLEGLAVNVDAILQEVGEDSKLQKIQSVIRVLADYQHIPAPESKILDSMRIYVPDPDEAREVLQDLVASGVLYPVREGTETYYRFDPEKGIVFGGDRDE